MWGKGCDALVMRHEWAMSKAGHLLEMAGWWGAHKRPRACVAFSERPPCQPQMVCVVSQAPRRCIEMHASAEEMHASEETACRYRHARRLAFPRRKKTCVHVRADVHVHVHARPAHIPLAQRSGAHCRQLQELACRAAKVVESLTSGGHRLQARPPPFSADMYACVCVAYVCVTHACTLAQRWLPAALLPGESLQGSKRIQGPPRPHHRGRRLVVVRCRQRCARR